MQYQIFDRFFPRARELRGHFDKRFRNPLEASADRFIWDYWHVPGEYTLLRRPAHAFFPARLYESFHRHLVEWGRETLGCHDVSPPWLSCYVEGCRQEAHQDLPHGPLAFVFSLTDWTGRRFLGGETFIGRGRKPVLIPSRFNRLLVFNPGVSHGVREVRRTHDLREGRLVINGWFVNPRPFWYGPLKAEDVRDAINSLSLPARFNPGRGFQSLRLEISARGQVRRLATLFSTLQGGREQDRKVLLQAAARLRFPAKKRGTRLTLPLMME